MTIVNDAPIKTLEQITAGDELETGGKAFNCSRLRRAGFAVPSGLVVLARATDDDIARAAVHAWLDTHPAGTRFAVRSSGIGEDGAGHSFAGVHETVLNVERPDIPEAVRRCRRSVHSAQAAIYRENRQIDEGSVRTGVLIQPMVAAVTSGVVFTVNPVTGADELVINAAPGLGEALVSGAIDPDEFRVRKIDGAILSSRRGGSGQIAGGRPALDQSAVNELSQLSMKIERLFAAPQDIEWSHDGQQFWILQSRPVTTAAAPVTAEIEWTRANLAEVFPDQMSPQVLAAYEDLLNRSEARFMGRLLAPGLGPMVKNFHGRLYFNLSQLRNVCRVSGAPASGLLRSLGHSDAIEPADEIAVRPPLREMLPLLPDFIRLVRNDRRAPKLMRQQEQAIDALVSRFAAARLEDMADAAILRELEEWLRTAPDYVQLVLVLGSVMMDEDQLRSACRRVGFSYDALVYPQLAAGERSVSTQQAFDLVALADVARQDPIAMHYFSQGGSQSGEHSGGTFDGFREALAGTAFLRAFERFIEQYGHRGHYESDWGLPRYREDPSSILFAIRSHLAKDHPDDRAATSRRLEREAAEAWRLFEARATRWQRWTLLPRVKATLRRLKRRYVMREKCRSDLTRVMAEVRRWHLELARRFVSRGLVRQDDYFLLHLDEIAAAVRDPASGAGLRAIAQARAAQIAAERDLRMPLLMRESGLEAALARTDVSSAGGLTRLTGLCVSPGRVDAEVVVILDPRHFRQMKRGAILVAPATDPSWTPLFTLAAGVIVEVGGMLSHASTIAREYGLPALANVKDATRRLHTGERVRLDATGGFVALEGSDTPRTAAEHADML